MALPSYNTSEEYLTDCLRFLQSFNWLFNYNNTHILVNKVFTNFPPDWLPYFSSLSVEELNKLPLGNTKENCPSKLKDVLETMESLKPNIIAYSQACNHNLSHNSGLSRKKMHEIIYLTPLIDKVCKESGTNFIIDVGAGLGYLSHLLNHNYKYRVLGIECSSENIKLAYKNQQKYFPYAKDAVNFTQHFINEDSCDTISQLAKKYFHKRNEKSACIVGLHACADLSITILDLFTKLEFVSCLVVMPCCYHRIKLEKTVGEKEYFKNFPASKLLRDLWEKLGAESFIRRPFLRLACQQTNESFINMGMEEHDQHSRSCMYRAILQEVVELGCKIVPGLDLALVGPILDRLRSCVVKNTQCIKIGNLLNCTRLELFKNCKNLKRKQTVYVNIILEHCRVSRLKRKSGKAHLPDIDEDFEAYLSNLKNTHRLEYDDSAKEKLEIDSDGFLEKMRAKWNEHKHNCYLMEVLTGFQASLQSICENVILLDRVEFLKEKGFHCYIEKVTDERISPRCYALVAVKS